jgi:hypothetical protein
MIDLLYALLAAARSSLKPQRELPLESLAFRRPLAVVQHKTKDPKLTGVASVPIPRLRRNHAIQELKEHCRRSIDMVDGASMNPDQAVQHGTHPELPVARGKRLEPAQIEFVAMEIIFCIPAGRHLVDLIGSGVVHTRATSR